MNASRQENAEAKHLDPLKEVYHESIIETPLYYERLISRQAALICIDLQYLDAAPGCGVFANEPADEKERQARAYYFDRLEDTVLPNVASLQAAFRKAGLEVVHTRIQSLTRDGRDRSAGHKRLGLLALPGSKEAEFLEQVAPREDDIVLNKTASGVFSSTNIHYVLNNIGVNELYIVGVYTNECVETTVRDACDLGYTVILVDDGCATVTPELHRATLQTIRDRYARVLSAEEAIEDISRYVIGKPGRPQLQRST